MARSFLQIAFVDILFVDILERCVLLAERERKRMVRLSEMCVHLRRSTDQKVQVQSAGRLQFGLWMPILLHPMIRCNTSRMYISCERCGSLTHIHRITNKAGAFRAISSYLLQLSAACMLWGCVCSSKQGRWLFRTFSGDTIVEFLLSWSVCKSNREPSKTNDVFWTKNSHPHPPWPPVDKHFCVLADVRECSLSIHLIAILPCLFAMIRMVLS